MTNRNSGQSLIETIMAIFVLTTGLSTGLALAIFAFGASSDVIEKISATALAREGIETVRRMRDSNWLAGNLTTGGNCGIAQACYETWLSQTYDIRGAVQPGTEYKINFNPASVLNKLSIAQAAGAGDNYRLYLQSGGGLSHTVSSQPSNFFRKVQIIQDSTSPPYSPTSPLVMVRSVVWWWGKTCPQITYFAAPNDTSCKIITEEYLTNWKNY